MDENARGDKPSTDDYVFGVGWNYGAYDLDSIMRYESISTNYGYLSVGDHNLIAYLYGEAPSRNLIMNINGGTAQEIVKLTKSAWSGKCQSFMRMYGTTYKDLDSRYGGWESGGWGDSYHDIDVDGDGIDELLKVYGSRVEVRKFDSMRNPAWMSDTYIGARKFTIADVDGDKREDLVMIYSNGTNSNVAEVYRSNGKGFTWAFLSSIGGNGVFYFGDVNGDSKTDIYKIYYNGKGRSVEFWISNGASFSWYSDSSVGGNGSRYFVVDLDNDKRSEIVKLYANGANMNAEVWRSDGRWFSWYADSPVGTGAGTRFFFNDVNGDKLRDLIKIYYVNGSYHAETWKCDGRFMSWAGDTAIGTGGTYDVLDFNGDGRTDTSHFYKNNTVTNFEIWKSEGGRFSWESENTYF